MREALLPAESARQVRVVLLPSESPRPGAVAIAEAVGRIASVPPESVRVTARCRRCGAADHGKPIVTSPSTPDGGWHVSLGRTAGWEAVAVTDAGPVGVDIVRIADVSRHPITAGLHPHEIASIERMPASARPERMAALWCVKEAVLKATGHGLHLDPALLQVAVGQDGDVTLLEAPAALGWEDGSTIDLRSPSPGILLAVALLAPPG